MVGRGVEGFQEAKQRFWVSCAFPFLFLFLPHLFRPQKKGLPVTTLVLTCRIRMIYNPHLRYPTTSWDMKGLANYLHIKGFKMGMYLTGGFNDVYGYEEQWAEVMFNEWGADSVKVDHMCSVADGAAPGKVSIPTYLPTYLPTYILSLTVRINGQSFQHSACKSI